MREHPARDNLAQLARLVAQAPEGGGRRRLHADGPWLYLHDPAMPALAHGWKLHVSARAAQLPLLLDLVVPVLLRRTCDAKFAAGAGVLGAMNSGVHGAAAVGKAVTVYPREGEVVVLGEELAQLLAGWDGPRVVSDRQVRAGSPVYYRYGPFRAPEDQDVVLMSGPDGRTFPGLAQPSYAQPPWAVDPFTVTAVPTAAPPKDTRVGEGRYRITAGISRAPGGHVYRGVELASGLGVVVKQARAFVGEDTEGVDARGRLRHERRVLAALAGVAGVPRLVDYFRHGADEYLVTSACGPRDLRRDVLAHGPYADGELVFSSGRNWWAAARALLRVLDAVHARGVVVCDLKPANVVRGEAGSWSLVDFGVSALDGERPAGATPGYGLPVAAAHPRPADDYYALGTTLHFALTGLDPVAIGPDPAACRDRTLSCLAAALPAPDHPALAAVAGLLSFDAGERTAAAAALREGRRAAAVRKVTRPTADHLGAAVAHTVGTCVRMARELLDAPPAGRRPRTLLSLYDGAAGLGLELLRHADEHPGAREAAAALARWTAGHPALGLLGPGLYDGRAGVELFLAHAAARLGTPEPAFAGVPDPGALAPGALAPGALVPTAQITAQITDQISGAAGIGTAHLLLADLVRASDDTRARRHLAVAAACACRLTDGPPQDLREEPNPGTAALAEGFAHGRAGLAHLLLALPSPDGTAPGDAAPGHAARDGTAPDGAALSAGRAIVEGLAAELPRLIADAARPGATRRWGSWCRGLAGIGTVLLQAGLRLREDAYVDLAAEAAGACRALAPRMGQVVQCCGLAGAGELFVDLALATGEERHREAAGQIAALVLSRAGGPPHRPVFPGTALLTESPAWAAGTPGVLTFLRRLHRLHRGAGPRPALLPVV